jgi:hypothetical protein
VIQTAPKTPFVLWLLLQIAPCIYSDKKRLQAEWVLTWSPLNSMNLTWEQMIQWFWGLRHEMVEDELRIVITYHKLDYPQIQTTWNWCVTIASCQYVLPPASIPFNHLNTPHLTCSKLNLLKTKCLLTSMVLFLSGL